MTVLAFHEMDVLFAVLIFERGIHFFYIEAAIRETRMAGAARCACLEPMFRVAGHATEPFMDSDGGAIVARANL